MTLRTGDVIASKYRITQKLGEGVYGKVYAAVDIHNRKYAVKIEKDAQGELYKESVVYEDIAHDDFGKRAIGVPRMFHFGQRQGHDLLVMEMLGSSLFDKVEKNGGTFSLKTCLMIAIQVITRLEHIHNCGFLHRDIKPDNLLTGRPGHHQRRIYIVDYGLADVYRTPLTGQHRGYRKHSDFTGTFCFSSANVMRGVRPSRRDDLESLAYVLLDLRFGRLPWSRGRDADKVLRMKMEIPSKELACGFPGMHTYLKYVKNLNFSDRPKYSYLRECFSKKMEEMGLKDDGEFDWVRHD